MKSRNLIAEIKMPLFKVRDLVRNRKTNEHGRITAIKPGGEYEVAVPVHPDTWELGSSAATWNAFEIEHSRNSQLGEHG